MFTSPGGGGPHNNKIRRRIVDRPAESVGLAGLTPHELRHTAASLAVAEGANVKAVQRILGHVSAAMTLDVYADLFEDDQDQVADHLDRAAASCCCGLRADRRRGTGSRRGPPRTVASPADQGPVWWGGRDSNPRPRDYESPALTD